MNKKNYRLYAVFTVLVFVAVIGIGLTVSAFSGSIMNVENFYESDVPAEQAVGAVSSPFNMGQPYTCDNEECTWIVKGTCADDTLDIVSFANPWGVSASTTVVDMVRVRIDGVATTTGLITCGAATAANGTPTYDLMTTGSIATSTGLGCVMENGLLTADNGNSKCPDGGSINKIALTQMYPYFNCEISGSQTGGFTEATNTFDCEYTVRIKQMR